MQAFTSAGAKQRSQSESKNSLHKSGEAIHKWFPGWGVEVGQLKNDYSKGRGKTRPFSFDSGSRTLHGSVE
jgi:hypothetical protein